MSLSKQERRISILPLLSIRVLLLTHRLHNGMPPLHRFLLRPIPFTFRPFTTHSALHAKPLPPRPTIDESTITEAFLKGTGPGGQKINKTSSAVQLKHLPTGIVIKCQETRSRSQNRKIARRILAERIETLELGDTSRAAIKAEREKRKKASKSKKAKRKYRKLAEGKEGEEDEDAEDVEDVVDGETPWSEDAEATKQPVNKDDRNERDNT